MKHWVKVNLNCKPQWLHLKIVSKIELPVSDGGRIDLHAIKSLLAITACLIRINRYCIHSHTHQSQPKQYVRALITHSTISKLHYSSLWIRSGKAV